MRPDRLHVAVRPRGILECLDLAVLFCGRRPLAVAAAAAIGAVPCILLNQVLLGAVIGRQATLQGLWAIGMEAPWAAAPLTLFLGQAVFADRFSWRLAARSLVGGLPAMILFQVMIRGACLATVVLAPVVAIGLYFLDPIILLERPPLSRVWSRRSAMNRHRLGHVISLAAVEALVLVVGWFLVATILAALGDVWNGSPPVVDDESVEPLATFFAWWSQAALWAAHAFVVVFRFFSYLDARIRGEGWDVELKFRSAATYAGLGRFRRVALAVAGLAALAVTAPALAAGDAAGPRAALERQRFPWYDAAADDYRPLVDVRAREAAKPRPRVEPSSVSGPGPGPGLDRGLQVVLLVAAVAAIAWVLVRYGFPDLEADRESTPERVAAVLGAEQLEALPEAARRHEGDLLAEASARAARGDFAAAMIFFHSWLLLQLHARGTLELARGKTNGRYVAEVASAAPAVAPAFARSTRLFEDAFFGRLPVAAEDFATVWQRRGGLADLEPAPK